MKGTPFDFFVQFHLTERCNLACRHCYQSGPVSEMNYEEICGVIADVKTTIEGWAKDYAMDVSPSLHFTGGEPLLRGDLFPILRYAWGCGFSTSLMSNGTLIDAVTAKQLRRAQVRDVQISLDGLEATHDKLRGSGSYQRTLTGIRNLAGEGLEVHLNVTVSRLNMNQTKGLVALAEEAGAGSIAFSRLVPSGRGKKLVRHVLTVEEVAAFYSDLRQYRNNTKVIVTSRDPLASIADLDGDVPQTELPMGGCAAGMFGVTIMADGAVMPCRRMDLPIGNIKTGSFRDLWADSPVLWQLRTRKDYHGSCQTCRYWPACRGCRAIALAFARAKGAEDYLGPDPQCPYYRSS
ncbi:MAG TPA: radical SAM protein [Dehalococcoidia bacterium]|nr:radical SAM protein [Dehalococcoidia bacterium]